MVDGLGATASLAWLDPSHPARECNCDGRAEKRTLHFSITKSDQSDSTGRNADSWISRPLRKSM